jgi:hypothetical protein
MCQFLPDLASFFSLPSAGLDIRSSRPGRRCHGSY